MAFGLCLVPLVVALGLFTAAIIILGDQFAPKLHWQPDYPGVFGLWPGIRMYLGLGWLCG